MSNPQIIKIKNKKKISTSNPPNNFAFQLHFERYHDIKMFLFWKTTKHKKKTENSTENTTIIPRPRMIEVLFIKD